MMRGCLKPQTSSAPRSGGMETVEVNYVQQGGVREMHVSEDMSTVVDKKKGCVQRV